MPLIYIVFWLEANRQPAPILETNLLLPSNISHLVDFIDAKNRDSTLPLRCFFIHVCCVTAHRLPAGWSLFPLHDRYAAPIHRGTVFDQLCGVEQEPPSTLVTWVALQDME